jgi:hypothetical protein
MGKLTFGGKTYQVSDGLAWPVLIVMTIFLFIYFFGFLIYGSEAVSFFLQIPRWSALLTIILLTFSIKFYGCMVYSLLFVCIQTLGTMATSIIMYLSN